MESRWKRIVTSAWFIVSVLVLALIGAILYYVFVGVDAALPGAVNSTASIIDKTQANAGALSTAVTEASGFVDKLTALIESLAKFFSVIPALIVAAGAVIAYLPKLTK